MPQRIWWRWKLQRAYWIGSWGEETLWMWTLQWRIWLRRKLQKTYWIGSWEEETLWMWTLPRRIINDAAVLLIAIKNLRCCSFACKIQTTYGILILFSDKWRRGPFDRDHKWHKQEGVTVNLLSRPFKNKQNTTKKRHAI